MLNAKSDTSRVKMLAPVGDVGSADVRETSAKTQKLDGEAVPLALRLLFKPALLAAAARPRPPTRLRPLLYDLSLDERSERSERSDMLRGPFDRSDGPTTAVYLRRQVRSSNPRAAIGFEALPQQGSEGGTAVAEEAPRRSSLIVGSQWTISCWVQLPLPPLPPRHGRDSVRRCDWVLAMGLGTRSAPGAPVEGGAAPVLPVCHVAFAEDYEGAPIDGRPSVRLAIEWDAPTGAERVVCLERFDLQSLPHGWHSIAAVGCPGSTTFYVDGRRRGAVPVLVSAPIVWIGNCFATDGRPDAAMGGLSDLRVRPQAAPCASRLLSLPLPSGPSASRFPRACLHSPLCSAPVRLASREDVTTCRPSLIRGGDTLETPDIPT